jgi:preprotein translocase subunit Sec61beta
MPNIKNIDPENMVMVACAIAAVVVGLLAAFGKL